VSQEERKPRIQQMIVGFKLPPPYTIGLLGLFLLGLETLDHAFFRVHLGILELTAFYLGDFFVIGLWLSIFVLPVWVLLWFVRNQRAQFYLFTTALLAFSLSWQASALLGQGVRRQPLFPLIEVAFILVFAVAALALVAFLLSGLSNRIKKVTVLVFIYIALSFNVFLLRGYPEFDGHLSLACALLLLYLTLPLLSTTVTKWVSGLLIGLFLVSAVISWPIKNKVLPEVFSVTCATHDLLAATPRLELLSARHTAQVSMWRKFPLRRKPKPFLKYLSPYAIPYFLCVGVSARHVPLQPTPCLAADPQNSASSDKAYSEQYPVILPLGLQNNLVD